MFPYGYRYFALVTDELLAGNLGKRKLKIRITRIYMCREFLYTGQVLGYKTYINIRSSQQVFKMVRAALLKEDKLR